jgi:hypothetical protein
MQKARRAQMRPVHAAHSEKANCQGNDLPNEAEQRQPDNRNISPKGQIHGSIPLY